MKTNRPKLNVPFETIDVVIELVAITLLLLMWTQLIIEYKSLPDTVAVHFNGVGKADGYSGKLFLWFLPSLATVIYIGLFILNRYPHLHNYMVNITEDNALKQYRFSTRILRLVNFLCTLMFAYISYKIILGAKSGSSELGMGFLFTVIGVSILLPIIILIYQQKLKSNSNV